jgi:hypothetical protein
MKYVIKTDEGYFYKLESANRVESGIVHTPQLATIYELPDELSIEELVKDFYIQYLYDNVKKDGGNNPRLVRVRIELEY